MPSKSKSQQRLFGMVHACQKTDNCASNQIKNIADSMTKKDTKDFAKTKHKKLPEKVKFKEWLENQMPAADEPQGGILGKYAFNQDRDDTMDFDFPPEETTELEVKIYGMINDWITNYTPMNIQILEQIYQMAQQGKYKNWFQIPKQTLYRGTLYPTNEISKFFKNQIPAAGTYNVQMEVKPGSPKQPNMKHSAWTKDPNVAANFVKRSMNNKPQDMMGVVFAANPNKGKFIDLAPFAKLFSAHTARYAGGESEVTGIGTVQSNQITVM